MFKLLLIIAVITYLVYKVGSFFFQAGAASQQFRANQRNPNPPINPSAKAKKSGKVNGGEYIDYEEVK